MARILVIEDEIEMALGLKDNFEFDGHEVIIANDGEDGLQKALAESPQLIILDVMLPKKSGFDVCKELRLRGVKTPIIMLTARGQEIDKVLGLELGADDYMTKPFSVRELLARVKAVLRRTVAEENSTQNVVQAGKISVDFEHLTAQDSSNLPIEMTSKEMEILKYFVQHPGQTITRDELLDKVWGYDIYPTSRTVDNYILKLRKKIEKDPGHPHHILTVHGMGYKYIP